MANQKLDQLDKQILRLIADDARIPFLEVARLCNVSGAAIHQRIQKLTNMGVLKGSQFIMDPEKLGYETCAYIGLNLKNPESFDEVVEQLKAIPEVVECHYTTGNYDLFLKQPTTITCSTSFTTSCSLWGWLEAKVSSPFTLPSTASCPL